MIPQNSLEKLWQKWCPSRYELVPTFWPGDVPILALATNAGKTAAVRVSELSYVYGLFSQAVRNADGLLPAVGYRIGAKAQPGGEDWTNGQSNSAIITGDKGSAVSSPRVWESFRSLLSSETLVITVDNNLPGAVDLLIDVGVWSLTVRERRQENRG
jgi:hypothetical protein